MEACSAIRSIEQIVRSVLVAVNDVSSNSARANDIGPLHELPY